MKTRVSLLFALSLAVLVPAPVEAGVVRVWGDQFNLNIINTFYADHGHDSAILSDPLTDASLTAVDLLWAVQPSTDYSASELGAMSSFLSGGGRIAFLGEHGTFRPDENIRISAAVAALGGHISINNIVLDIGFRTASKLDGQIVDHPLTAGVDQYRYAAFAPLILGAGAQALMRGEDMPNEVMMAYENVGAGSIFLITDQNPWDVVANPEWNNTRMFLNLVDAPVIGPGDNGEIPEPGTVLLVGAGLGMAALIRRRLA